MSAIKNTRHAGVDQMNRVVIRSRAEWLKDAKVIIALGGKPRTMREKDGSITYSVNAKGRIIEVFNW